MPYKDPNSEAAKASLKRRRKKYFDTHGGYTEATKNYPSRQKAAHKSAWYKCQYGVTLEEFEAQIERQHGLCPIGNHPFGPRGKTAGAPCQDHNHETGENRLILCREHNVGLGCFKDSVPELEAAILYLNSFKKEKGELPCLMPQPYADKSRELSN
jgi:hypothetical protein